MGLSVNKITHRVIFVEPQQDIASIIDEIREVKESRIYLYIPGSHTAFTNSLNMQLMRNEGADLEKDIVVVSENIRIRKAAAKAEVQSATTLPDDSYGREKGNEDESSVSYGKKMYDIVPPHAKEEADYVSPQFIH